MGPLPKSWWVRSGQLLRLGIVTELRRPRVRAALVAAAAFGALIGVANTNAAGATAVWLGAVLTPLLGVAASLWFGRYACRDLDARRSMLRNRPVDGAYLTGILWATGLALWLIGTVPAFLAAAVVQTPFAPLTAFPAHLATLARTALTVACIGTLGFAVSRGLRTGAGGLLVAAGWGVLHLAAGSWWAFQPEYSQHALPFGALALLALGITGLLVERRRRGELRRLALPAGVVAALLLTTVAAAARTAWPGEAAGEARLRQAMAAQSLAELQPAPGFWLPDGRGGVVRTADHPGKVLLIYLFDAHDLAACRALPALDRVRRERSTEGVMPLGVSISPSQADAWTVATQSGLGFPVGIDAIEPGERPGGASSPLTRAYHPTSLPLLVVTDRQHRVRQLIQGWPPDLQALRQIVAERLQEEPGAGVEVQR